MIVLDRLHRGDFPHYRPVVAEQSEGRLVFTDKAGADAFVEAYSRADRAASFRLIPVPEISLQAFWETCRDHDWHYANSDAHNVWREGGQAAGWLSVQSVASDEHRRIYMAWKRHHFSGPNYGTEQRPAPEDPRP